MKVYLASGAPGNETVQKLGMLPIKKRLLSYFHIISNQLENNNVFNAIKNENKKK